MVKIKSILEALLFSSSTPLSSKKLKEVLGVDSFQLDQAFEELKKEYEKEGRGFSLRKVAGGYQFYTLPQFSSWIKKLKKEKPVMLSRPALETLAIVAYRQPVTRRDIEQVRGVESREILRNLKEKNLIQCKGRKESMGKPFLYGTTSLFLKHFGLNSLSELPKIEELSEPR